MNRNRIVFLVISLCWQYTFSQSNGIILDKLSGEPIPYVSIYSKKSNNITGTMSDEKGYYNFAHEYDTLYFSHINYEDAKKITSSRNDTLFLSPKTFTLNDIIVQSRNLNWIQHLLKQIVNKKDSLYKINDNTLSYNFISKSLTDSTLYQFNSIGYMRYPDYKGKQSFTICPIKNVMKTNIEGADGDFAQISRSVYHSFINDFDHDFIKNTDFKLISFADENLSGLLKFSYISKRHPDHTGFFIVDTLQKAIIEFEQKAGSDYNIKNNTTAITRILASNRGFKYKLWETTIYGKYKKLNDKYYMSECRYQYFVQTENKNKVYFSNIESTLALKESDFYNTNNCKWMELPSPYSILIIKSKSRRIAEEALIQVPLIIEDL